MEQPLWIRRNTRTTMVQLDAFMTFLEANPEFLQSNPFKKDTKYTTKKWNELAGILNSLRGPSKKPREWKFSLIHWKNQLKSRTRKIRSEQIVTVDGSSNQKISLSSLEARALSLFGEITIENNEILRSEQQVHQPIPPTNSLETSVQLPSPSQSFKVEPVDIDIGDSENSETIESGEFRKRERSRSLESTDKKFKFDNSRDEYDKKIIEQQIEIERQNSQAVNKMADALTKMADALLIFAEAYAKK